MDWLQPEIIISVFVSVVGFIVWLIRLEGKVYSLNEANKETQKDVDNLRAKQEAVDEKISLELKEINQRLAQIEGFLLRPKSGPKK